MQTGEDRQHAIVGRISARLQTLIGTGRAIADFEALCAEAGRRLGPDHETTLLTEYHLEIRRDRDRSPAGSVPVWESLRDRAGKSLPTGTPAELAIRFRCLRRLRCRGRRGDLDLLVELCREEISHRAAVPDPYGAGEARSDLALALRDRACLGAFTSGLSGGHDPVTRPTAGDTPAVHRATGNTSSVHRAAGDARAAHRTAGDARGVHRAAGNNPAGRHAAAIQPTGGNGASLLPAGGFDPVRRAAGGFDPVRDLGEAVVLIGGEVRRHADSPVPDLPAALAARRVQAEVMLAAGRADPAAAALALEITEDLVRAEEDVADLRDGAYDHLTPTHVLLAEALLLAGRAEEAARVARLAYALHAGNRVFDPARPLLVLARAEARTDPVRVLTTARAALDQRLATFSGDSPYIAEALALAGSLE